MDTISILRELAYLVTAITFIIGLRRLSSPATARSGNQIAAAGMALAVLTTLLNPNIKGIGYLFIGVGALIGGGIGFYLARTVQMTAMPQMVALFNGMGGGAAALSSSAEFLNLVNAGGSIPIDTSIATVLGAVIGSISMSGSVIALGKLQGFVSGSPVTYPGQQIVNAIIAILIVLLGAFLVVSPNTSTLSLVLLAIIVLAVALGIAIVLPIGGADMPVVISLLNSFTGLAAAFTGFVLHSNVLIISGALVGASGTLLTLLMGKAMNRSVTNVLFGAFGTGGSADVPGGAAAADSRPVREISPEDAATLMAYANEVIIVPGYGMAVAQAQHTVQELANMLEQRGVEVKYAIHPVAGRMPGHMNVLLAEANVPYNQLYEMDDINPEFSRTDVALVIGANDVTNPAARTDPKSPIYGMPILDVDKAGNVIVMKRSMKSGFAGIDNDLYYEPKTSMLFGDAKAT
ncbi:MAG: NAD(P)(+) transhydrogenase (Re/Si-specific) subunit beta, partial [Chloroflexia bacterium]